MNEVILSYSIFFYDCTEAAIYITAKNFVSIHDGPNIIILTKESGLADFWTLPFLKWRKARPQFVSSRQIGNALLQNHQHQHLLIVISPFYIHNK